jgi:hypothetical protein
LFFQISRIPTESPTNGTSLILVASGTFSWYGQGRLLKEDDILPETFKTPFWKGYSSEVRLNLNNLEITLV